MKGKTDAKNIGIPNVTYPSETCSDANCPFHSRNVTVRGRLFEGKVMSAKPTNTVVVQWARRLYVPKYERFEKRWSKVNAHTPPCLHIKKDDTVTIAECRPISKTKKFVVINRIEGGHRTSGA
jgi:small subunit ribosomal protein S17